MIPSVSGEDIWACKCVFVCVKQQERCKEADSYTVIKRQGKRDSFYMVGLLSTL